MVVAPQAGVIYVIALNSVIVIDTTSDEVLGKIGVGTGLTAITLDRSLATSSSPVQSQAATESCTGWPDHSSAARAGLLSPPILGASGSVDSVWLRG